MIYKQIQKITKIKTFLVLGLILGVVALPMVTFAAPVGCGDGGTAVAGTVCPDGSTPVKDTSLPWGCPGSAVQSVEPASYTATCPARPGRSECIFTLSTAKCVTAAGADVTKGDSSGAAGQAPAATSTIVTEPNARVNDCNGQDINRDNCGIVKYLVLFINVLSAVVGIVVTGVIIWGGIEYSTSGGDPGKVQAAKKKIYNGVLSLVAFIFTYAFLQYIVPGGVL